MMLWDDDHFLPTWREVAIEVAWCACLAFIVTASFATGLAYGAAQEATAYADLVNEARVAQDYARATVPMSERVIDAGGRALLATDDARARLSAEIQLHEDTEWMGEYVVGGR